MNNQNLKITIYVSLCAFLSLLIFSNASAQPPGPTEARLLFGGNYADPTILKYDGKYYMTHSSFNFRPGLLIWKSDDLKEWNPLTYALHNFKGNVWAPELIEYAGLFYIYFPGAVDGQFENFVITADKLKGPWSEAMPLGVGHIDPGHIVGDDGKRYIHLSGGHVVEISDDGLLAVSEPEKIMEGWPIPEDWAIECFCLESPKLTKLNDWYYLTAAQGGTFGPSTSHMQTAFRSKSPIGPWESSPYNPVIRTWSRSESWWSKGHGTLVEGPQGQWFSVLHGIPNGYRTLGRATLIEPIEWDGNEWYYVPKKWPKVWGKEFHVNMPLSDEFDGNEIGIQWQFLQVYGVDRIQLKGGKLEMKGAGDSPGSSFPLTVIPRDKAYEIETTVEVSGDAKAGIMLFVSQNEYMGLSVDAKGQISREQENFRRYRNTDEPKTGNNRVSLKIVNDKQDVRFYFKSEGEDWKLMQPSMEVSQNGIIRPSIYVYGDGEARFEYFHYRLIED
jgi:xylan 1,4-beta-xylosidase